MQPKQPPVPDPQVDCPEFYSYARLVERMVAPGDDPREFKKLYDQLVLEWQPAGPTEWHYLLRILTARWMFGRLDMMECLILARIGRAVCEQDGDLTLRQAFGAALRQARASLKSIARLRGMQTKSIELYQRGLTRVQRGRERGPKPAAAGAKAKRPAIDIASLPPGSDLIQ